MQGTTLKHLSAGQGELMFRGESSRRAFPIILSPREVDLAQTFQVGFENTAAVLPERSSLVLVVNGHPLTAVPIDAPSGLSTVSVPVPSGVLKPGSNAIEIQVSMTHRVDPSIGATFELWTALNAAKTGLVVPHPRAAPVHSIGEIAAEAVASDGMFHLQLVQSGAPGDASLTEAARFIDALVARAGLVRPVIDVGPGSGRGPGVDVVLGTADPSNNPLNGLTVVGTDEDLTFARDLETDRLVVVLSGTDRSDLDRKVADFAAKVPASPVAKGNIPVEGGTHISFADLGLHTDAFTGRRYTTALNVTLPADFYPANTDSARLLLDAAFSSDLDPRSELLFTVNGVMVGSLGLAPERRRELRHEAVELPLRFFHPGPNEIRIDGTLPTAADKSADPVVQPNNVRFTLAETSELEIPHFASLGTAPQIPAALDDLKGTGQKSVRLYLAGSDPTQAGAALTALANMAVGGQPLGSPSVHLGMPTADDAPGIVMAPWSGLPRSLTAVLPEQPAGTAKNTLSQDIPAVGRTSSDALNKVLAMGVDFSRRANLSAIRSSVDGLLRRNGFLFGTTGSGDTVPFDARKLLVAATEPRLQGPTFAGLTIPRLTTDSRQWLIITAHDPVMLREGVDRLVSDGRWASLQGRAASIDVDTGAFSTVQPRQTVYVMPTAVPASDLRPIFGGLVSSNIGISLAGLLVLMTLLGLSTHIVIRHSGAK